MNGFASAVALILLAIQVTNAGFVKTAGTALRYTYYYTGTTARHRSQKAYESNHALLPLTPRTTASDTSTKLLLRLRQQSPLSDLVRPDVYVKQLGRALHQRKGEGCVKEVHRHLRQQIQGGRHHHDLGAMQRMPAAVYEAWRDAVSVVGSNMQYWEFCLKPLSLRVHIFGTDEIFKSAIVPAAKKFKTPA
ncbi:hypothetical protein PF008_g26962 [Phytophthora fragariae]|uniref:RxLR effector protein n=1 Tax=Phytophthora fragariae TaxID=53985 RepID=A0A6G0QFQ8_9STRA|nr:hypothetical protein PF008_g26962 [Phytophthora fragariae]